MNTYIYLFFCCVKILVLYPCVHLALSYNDRYKKYDYNKKCYILKNFIKSVMLCFCIYNFHLVLQDIYNGIWISEDIHKIASNYVSNDIMGLILLKKLPASTKLHHITSSILLFYSYTLDYTQNNIGQLLLILTLFSSYSFLVNFYLALRYFERKNDMIFSDYLDRIRICAYYIYIVCCFISWSSQSVIVMYKFYFNLIDIYHILYLFILFPIIKDDLILMSWLRKKKEIKL